MTLKTWIDLHPEERFIALVRPSVGSSMGGLFFWFVICVFPFFLVGPVWHGGWGAKAIWFLVLLTILFLVGRRMRRFLRTAIVLTTHRLRIVRPRGWWRVRAKATDYALASLSVVKVGRRSILERLTRSGTLLLEYQQTKVQIARVPAPERLVTCIEELTKELRGV